MKKKKIYPANAKTTTKTCPECGMTFEAYRSNAICCSDRCRKRRSLDNIASKKQKLREEAEKLKEAKREYKERLEYLVTYPYTITNPEGPDKPPIIINDREEFSTHRRKYSPNYEEEKDYTVALAIVGATVAVAIVVYILLKKK